MKSWQRHVALVACVWGASLTLGSVLGQAQPAAPPAGGPGHGPGGVAQRLQTLGEQLNLSDEQKQKLRDLVEQVKKDQEAFTQAHGEEFKQAVEKLHAAQKAVEDLRQMSPETTGMEKFKALLTPEQQQKLAEVQAKAEQFRREHGLPGLADKLKLSEEQRGKLRAIVDDSREALRQFREDSKEQIGAALKDLRAARESGDAQKLEAARQSLRELFENAPAIKQLEEKIKTVLTPEQVEQWQKLGAERFGPLGLPGGPEGPEGPGGAGHGRNAPAGKD